MLKENYSSTQAKKRKKQIKRIILAWRLNLVEHGHSITAHTICLWSLCGSVLQEYETLEDCLRSFWELMNEETPRILGFGPQWKQSSDKAYLFCYIPSKLSFAHLFPHANSDCVFPFRDSTLPFQFPVLSSMLRFVFSPLLSRVLPGVYVTACFSNNSNLHNKTVLCPTLY